VCKQLHACCGHVLEISVCSNVAVKDLDMERKPIQYFDLQQCLFYATKQDGLQAYAITVGQKCLRCSRKLWHTAQDEDAMVALGEQMGTVVKWQQVLSAHSNMLLEVAQLQQRQQQQQPQEEEAEEEEEDYAVLLVQEALQALHQDSRDSNTDPEDWLPEKLRKFLWAAEIYCDCNCAEQAVTVLTEDALPLLQMLMGDKGSDTDKWTHQQVRYLLLLAESKEQLHDNKGAEQSLKRALQWLSDLAQRDSELCQQVRARLAQLYANWIADNEQENLKRQQEQEALKADAVNPKKATKVSKTRVAVRVATISTDVKSK